MTVPNDCNLDNVDTIQCISMILSDTGSLEIFVLCSLLLAPVD
jgi:hypothetical protein